MARRADSQTPPGSIYTPVRGNVRHSGRARVQTAIPWLVAVVAVAIAAWALWDRAESQRAAPGVGQINAKADPREDDHMEREAVRRWIFENSDTGTLEEVRWWRSHSTAERNARDLKTAKQELANAKQKNDQARIEYWQAEIDSLEAAEPVQLIRLKWRNGQFLDDRIFGIVDGKVTSASQSSHHPGEFPE